MFGIDTDALVDVARMAMVGFIAMALLKTYDNKIEEEEAIERAEQIVKKLFKKYGFEWKDRE